MDAERKVSGNAAYYCSEQKVQHCFPFYYSQTLELVFSAERAGRNGHGVTVTPYGHPMDMTIDDRPECSFCDRASFESHFAVEQALKVVSKVTICFAIEQVILMSRASHPAGQYLARSRYRYTCSAFMYVYVVHVYGHVYVSSCKMVSI